MNTVVRRKIRLGELLVQNQVITAEQLTKALAEQKRTGRKLGRVLADLGMVAEAALHEFLSKHLQVPFVDLKQLRIDGEAVRLLPEPLARRHRALVLQQDARGLLVGMADPTDLIAFDELQSQAEAAAPPRAGQRECAAADTGCRLSRHRPDRLARRGGPR